MRTLTSSACGFKYQLVFTGRMNGSAVAISPSLDLQQAFNSPLLQDPGWHRPGCLLPLPLGRPLPDSVEFVTRSHRSVPRHWARRGPLILGVDGQSGRPGTPPGAFSESRASFPPDSSCCPSQVGTQAARAKMGLGLSQMGAIEALAVTYISKGTEQL